MPTEDTGQIRGPTETLGGSSCEAMRDHQLAVADILRRDPNVDHFMSSIGGGTMNQGRVSLRLKPRGSRPTADAVIRELMPKLNSIPGVRTYLQVRSEEHTSELQSHLNLVCRLLLEKKKKT